MDKGRAKRLLDELEAALAAVDTQAVKETLAGGVDGEQSRDHLLFGLREFVRRNLPDLRDLQYSLLDEEDYIKWTDEAFPDNPESSYDSPWEALWSERMQPIVLHLLMAAGKGVSGHPEIEPLTDYLPDLVKKMKFSLPIGDSSAPISGPGSSLTRIQLAAFDLRKEHREKLTGTARRMLRGAQHKPTSYDELQLAMNQSRGTLQNHGPTLESLGLWEMVEKQGSTKLWRTTPLGTALLEVWNFTI